MSKGRDFIKQFLSYFFWKWPYKSEAIKMDAMGNRVNKARGAYYGKAASARHPER
ncbi:hypothetical protein [Fibrobacter sp. UWB12]|uniref:hypothetical protein n=1 Tax=Fibrobacter sp. UWB12 TaxID=1896203 RepID=UPI0015873BAE|nr:hypothetical protein [Fibrobacter sp. UWB12]